MAHLPHLVSVALIALILLNSSNMSEQAPSFLQTLSRMARSTNETVAVDEDCEFDSICGWAVYERFTKKLDYYLPMSCKCPEPSQCVKTEENDVQINAQRYRCKSLTSAPAPAVPESSREANPPKVQ